jgi:tetratricopeptide (TPR) repeat protein
VGTPAAVTTRAILALALVCSLAGSGCLRRILPQPRPAEPKATLISVPYVEPRTDECGPASLAMMLQWSGLAVDAEALAPALMAEEKSGALQISLVAETRRQGRLAYPIAGTEELLRELEAGHPVLVLQNLGLSWLQYWHYAVVIGADRERQVMVLHSGKDASREVEFAIFDRTWERAERWGLVILPPTQLPATATEPRVVDAAVGLERAGRNDAAALAYRSALKRWPVSLTAWIGLGNAEFAGGDLSAAEQAFRLASELHPRSAAARNNLAYVRAQISGGR